MENVVQMPSISESGRRRAVSTTLKQWFGQETILEALCVIEETFGEVAGSNIGVIKLTNVLADHFGWDTQIKHDVRMSLYRNMLPSANLDADPVTEFEAYKARRRPKAPVEEPEPVESKPVPSAPVVNNRPQEAANHSDVRGEAAVFIVFSRVIESVRQQIKTSFPRQFGEFHAAVNSEIHQLTLSPYVIQWVESVFKNAEGTLTNSGLTEVHMSSIVHAFYNGVADAIGPMDADKVLTAAVSDAEQIPAAMHFSPKNFL